MADALAERLSLTNAEIDAMMPASWTARAYEPCGGPPWPCGQLLGAVMTRCSGRLCVERAIGISNVIDPHTFREGPLLINFLYSTSIEDSCGNQPFEPWPAFFQGFVISEIIIGARPLQGHLPCGGWRSLISGIRVSAVISRRAPWIAVPDGFQ